MPAAFWQACSASSVARYSQSLSSLAISGDLYRRIVDPVEEGVDLSIRFGELRDSGERFAVPGIWQTRDEDGPAPPHRDLEELCPLDRRRVPLAEAAAVRPALPSGAPLGECASEADAAPPRRMRTANLHALPN